MGGSGIRYNVRRLLLDAAEEIGVPPASAGNPFAGGASEDIVTNLVIKLVVLLLLAMTCVLVLKSIVRRALRRCGGVSLETAAATAGMEKRDLRRIPVAAYRVGAGIAEECSICLADFAEGERVRVLPGCGHGFHVACVDRWLVSNSSCPNCRHSLLENKSAPSKAADGGGGRRPDVESGGGGG